MTQEEFKQVIAIEFIKSINIKKLNNQKYKDKFFNTVIPFIDELTNKIFVSSEEKQINENKNDLKPQDKTPEFILRYFNTISKPKENTENSRYKDILNKAKKQYNEIKEKTSFITKKLNK